MIIESNSPANKTVNEKCLLVPIKFIFNHDYNTLRLRTCTYEMCPVDTDASAVAKLAYSHKVKNMTYFDAQKATTFEATR